MLKDNNHDLIKQLSVTSSGLWRIKEEYKKNSAGCKECQRLWKEVEKKLEDVSTMIVKEINRHAKEDKFK